MVHWVEELETVLFHTRYLRRSLSPEEGGQTDRAHREGEEKP